MAFKPLRMDKRELNVKYSKQGKGIKQIARLLGVSKNTVKAYIGKHHTRDENNSDEENNHYHHQYKYTQSGILMML